MRNQGEDRKGNRKRLLRNGSLYLWPALRSGVAYCLYILMERYDRHADRRAVRPREVRRPQESGRG